MSDDNTGEFGTYAEYDFKGDIKRQYGIAYTLMSEYVCKPNHNNEKHARLSLTKLMYPLFPKLFVLKDQQAINYISYFMLHPDKFSLFDLQAVFLILQRTVEKIGLTKFEDYRIPKHQSYKDSGD